MALAAKLRTLVQNAIVSIGDLKDTITYTQVVPGVYDPVTDTTTNTTTVHNNVDCALVKLTEDDLDWFPANTNGQKALIPYLNLPIVPSDDDYVTINSVRWNVHKIKQVPGRSLHIIYIREP